MHFNTKHIFKGDNESQIVEKINYNFNQILSSAVGPNGRSGPKGSIGFPGPAGKRGITGPTGFRATNFIKQDTTPATADANPYDYWIDSASSEYKIYSYGITGSGSWAFSGYSLFSSPYFDVFENIVGPAGANDRFAISFKNSSSILATNGLTVSDMSLVISDSAVTSSNANPNRSKLLISTRDQTSRPILSFNKTGSSNTGVPSFYWDSTGTSSDLTYTSNGSLTISSLLGLSIDSYTANSILNGGTVFLTSNSNITIGGTGNFYLNSNVTTGIGTDLVVGSTNLQLTSSSFSYNRPIKITNSSFTGSGYVFDTTKNSTSTTLSRAGIDIFAVSSANSFYEFRDSGNAVLLSTIPRASVETAKYGQTTFGSTGGLPAGGTGGPYFYHVKRTVEYVQGTVGAVCSPSLEYGGLRTTIENIFDISSANFFTSDVIILTPTSFTAPSNANVYVKIPVGAFSSLAGVYEDGRTNSYKLILNDPSPNPFYKFAGLVYDYQIYSLGSFSFFDRTYFNFLSSTVCPYIEITYLPAANPSNGNPRVFWKTCDGRSGFFAPTNRVTVGTITGSGTIPSGSA